MEPKQQYRCACISRTARIDRRYTTNECDWLINFMLYAVGFLFFVQTLVYTLAVCSVRPNIHNDTTMWRRHLCGIKTYVWMCECIRVNEKCKSIDTYMCFGEAFSINEWRKKNQRTKWYRIIFRLSRTRWWCVKKPHEYRVSNWCALCVQHPPSNQSRLLERLTRLT